MAYLHIFFVVNQIFLSLCHILQILKDLLTTSSNAREIFISSISEIFLLHFLCSNNLISPLISFIKVMIKDFMQTFPKCFFDNFICLRETTNQ